MVKASADPSATMAEDMPDDMLDDEVEDGLADPLEDALPDGLEDRLEDAPDEMLVVAAILGNFEAFDELVARYRAAAVRVAQAIVGRENAEDVAQEALLLAFKALPSIEEPTKFAAWLSAITRHRAFRFGKRESAHQKGRIELDEFLLEEVETLSRPFVREANEELARALEAVSADYAMVLRMRFLDEMPLKRIAAFLGVPVSTVKWRVHQGKKLLRAEISRLRGE